LEKILLTGAAGFIGYHTALKLLEKDEEVIGLDNLNNYYDIRLKEHRLNVLKQFKNFEFQKIDIENYDALEVIFKRNKFKSIINLAARAGVSYSKKNPFVYLSTNTRGPLNILELMKKYNYNKLVQASTSSLYAGEQMPFNEDLPVNTPISVYAATKKAAELLAYTYHSLYDLDITILRYFTVYGPAGRPDMSIFRFIKWIDEGKPIELFGDGTQSRDFTYVEDIVNGTMKAQKALGYEVINLGGGNKPISLNEVIKLISELLNKEPIIKYFDFQNTDIKETQADISKAKQLLNWEPQFNFNLGIEMTVKWYKENRNWLKDINL